jgi:hypothetical protein
MKKATEEKVKMVKEIAIVSHSHIAAKLKWLAKAQGLDDARKFMGAIHINKGYAFSTNGNRFFVAIHDCFGGKALPVGDYEISRANKKEMILRETKDRVWPDNYRFETIFPDCSEYKSIELQLSSEYAPGYAYAKLIRACPMNINYDYFVDMFPTADHRRHTESMTVYYPEKNDLEPIVAHADRGKDGAYIAIVMPLSY